MGQERPASRRFIISASEIPAIRARDRMFNKIQFSVHTRSPLQIEVLYSPPADKQVDSALTEMLLQ